MRISVWSSDVCSSDLLQEQCDQLLAELRLLFGKHLIALFLKMPGHVLEHVLEHGFEGLVHAMSKNAQLRSEEHTSELQSLMRISYAVFCLKKKKYKKYIRYIQSKVTTKKMTSNTITK